MEVPELIFITGCNAAGKSSLIRTHLSLFPGFEVIMTDVYKARAHKVFKEAVSEQKNIILETPFKAPLILSIGSQLAEILKMAFIFQPKKSNIISLRISETLLNITLILMRPFSCTREKRKEIN